MISIQRTARSAGILYLLFALLAIVGYMYVPGRFLVPGDAAATARRIAEGETLYRIGILAALAAHITFIVLALTLYRLFKDVDVAQARLLVALVCVGATAEIVNLANRLAPLILLSGADYLNAIPKPQLDALALGFLRLGNGLGQILTAFWGLWLFPFGVLTIRSGYFPRFLGILLFVSGFAYVATCVVRLVLPEQFRLISPFVTPLYLGEVVMVLWMAIMGAKMARAGTQAAAG